MTQPAPVPRRPPARFSKRRPIRVAVLYNVDFEDTGPEGDPGYAARADVEIVARSIATTLSDGAHEAHLIAIDGDMHELRTRLLELEPDCAFNLCESLAGDARLETAVPLLVELLGIPCTGSSPEALSQALYKDRVKHRLQKAGVPTPRSCVMARPDDPCDLPFPVIVKPVREDGSAGITSASVVHDREGLRAVVASVVTAFRQPCLVECFVAGRELNVALFGFPTARVLPLSEIDFSPAARGGAEDRVVRRQVARRLRGRPGDEADAPPAAPPGGGGPRAARSGRGVPSARDAGLREGRHPPQRGGHPLRRRREPEL